jgi:hypothetical protein
MMLGSLDAVIVSSVDIRWEVDLLSVREACVAGELIESTISSMIQWLEDVRQVDGFADWGMGVLGLAFLN